MTDSAPTTTDLADALAALGETPNAVADTLTQLGHRGRPGCDTNCPVANYLTALFGTHGACSVLYDELGNQELVAEIAMHEGGPVVAVAVLPPAVAGFVHRFDRKGDYVDLDTTAEEATR